MSISRTISLDPLAKAIGGLVPGLQWVGLGMGMGRGADEPVWYETRREKAGVSVRSVDNAEARAIERALERLDVYE